MFLPALSTLEERQPEMRNNKDWVYCNCSFPLAAQLCICKVDVGELKNVRSPLAAWQDAAACGWGYLVSQQDTANDPQVFFSGSTSM